MIKFGCKQLQCNYYNLFYIRNNLNIKFPMKDHDNRISKIYILNEKKYHNSTKGLFLNTGRPNLINESRPSVEFAVRTIPASFLYPSLWLNTE